MLKRKKAQGELLKIRFGCFARLKERGFRNQDSGFRNLAFSDPYGAG